MIEIESYENFNNNVTNQIKESKKKETNQLFRKKDKSDRATVELCLDPKTIAKLEKLINKGDLERYEGCISTGKEANVYFGKGFEGKNLAIKVYKTSILVFKDRERYITGEFRFRHGYCKSNPRKMVAIWAEKEVRNLKRIQLSGLKTANPLLLKSNLIIMELIGNGEQPAPRLKDAEVENYEDSYFQVVFIMSVMFKKCKLVHSDLSEYNLLYLNNEIYVIDVGQSVEDDHPNALHFLKRDCTNINIFFERHGVDVLTNRQLFNIITCYSKKELSKEEVQVMINQAREINLIKEKLNKDYFSLDNNAFENFEFPRTLKELDELKIEANFEIRAALQKLCGIVEGDSNYSKNNDESYLLVDEEKIKKVIIQMEIQQKLLLENKIIRQNKILLENTETNEIIEENDDEENESDEEEEDELSFNEEEEKKNEDLKLFFDEDGKIIDKETSEKLKLIQKEKKPHNWNPFEGLSKKERQKKVKEENREKRANKKLSKYEKQKKIEKTSGKKYK